MKNFLKYAAVGVAGYLIGFYEFKYKVVKAMASVNVEQVLKNHTDKDNEL